MMPAALFVLILVFGQGPPAGSGDLVVVRDHYAEAAYEDVLVHVNGLDAEQVTPSLEQYRALCLFALGRFREGEEAFERLVRRSPDFVIPEGAIAPRLFIVFREVRRRVLPSLAQAAYDRGQAHFDAGRLAEAVKELRRVEQLLDDPDLQAEPERTADLRRLAEGFLRLAEMSTAELESVEASTPGGSSAGGERLTPASPARAADRVYSASDADVTPPTEVSRVMPVWDPPAVMARYLEYRGEIDVVVDERGRVAEAEITRRSIPSYDASLMDAIDSWRFEPARRAGAPVAYRLSFQFVLAPTR